MHDAISRKKKKGFTLKNSDSYDYRDNKLFYRVLSTVRCKTFFFLLPICQLIHKQSNVPIKQYFDERS